MASKRDQIADTIRARIVSKHVPHGHVASVAGLCDEFQVATGTAVAAMRVLIEGGYAYSDQSGYYMSAILPTSKREDEQRAVVAALKEEAQRLDRLANRLERAI